MSTWILIVYIYAGMLASGDSVTLNYIPDWNSKATCEAAARELAPLVAGSSKVLKTVCVEKKAT
jgi:hypothetical protein